MEIYRLYVHYTKECKPGCNYEIYCLRQDENWSDERYFIGPKGLKTAKKNFELAKKDSYSDIIEIDECKFVDDDGRVVKTKTIKELWKNSAGKWS